MSPAAAPSREPRAPAVEVIGPGEQPPHPVIQTIPFAIPPPLPVASLPSTGRNGIVGSIVRMGKKSAMVWVGWGLLEEDGAPASASRAETAKEAHGGDPSWSGFGTGTPAMGQLVLAMPRTRYAGAFSPPGGEAPCSQLVGSASSEDQMLANQMAARLSSRSGMAIYVSCRLSSLEGLGGSPGPEADTLCQRAAALAEREAWKILREQQQQ